MNDCLTLDVIRRLSVCLSVCLSDICLSRTRVVHVISKTPERISMKFSMCILICMGSICIVFGGWGTSTFFYFLQILQYFCYLFSLLLALLQSENSCYTGKLCTYWENQEKILSFSKKIGFFSKWHFSQKNRIFLEMTVKTSQENKEFWRKTKFLHILGVVLAGFHSLL